MPASKHLIRATRTRDGATVKMGGASCYAEATAKADRLLTFEDPYGDGAAWERVWIVKDGKTVWEATRWLP